MTDRLRLGLVGTGWITDLHLRALARLDRAVLAAVVSRSIERAEAVTARWGGTAYAAVGAMLETERPDAVYVCLPPNRSPAVCELLAERGVPFLTEKPLASESEDAERVGDALATRDLVAAVGYQWRGFDFLPLVRQRLAERPARLVLGRWTGGLPAPSWWRHVAESGGQAVEQATHLYDMGRYLLGEAEVVAAAAARWPRAGAPDSDVDDVEAALVRFQTGAIGSFANTSLLASDQIELDLLSDDARTTIRMHPGPAGPRWSVTLDDPGGERIVETARDPYEIQSEAFLEAVVARDPTRVLSSYADALKTDRLVRAVVSAKVAGASVASARPLPGRRRSA